MFNVIQKGKTALIVLGVLAILFSIGFAVGGVFLLIDAFTGETFGVVQLIFGIILCILFIPFIIIGIYFVWIGAVMKATKGSVVEGNVGMGTMNATLCDYCGAQITNEKFCPNCGRSTDKSVSCPKCGFSNHSNNSHCANCGEILK